ncbi:MAG TPA: hypothetical protein VEU51_08175 [Candidatus Acidoferrales bacterium]|nr:hypothetical protein [Candidatus Acidoferrales bacterium]
MTDWRVLDVALAGLNRADHDLPGVHADANLDRCAAVSLKLGAVATQLLLHPERGVECALRMVLVSDWRAEQREDPVASRLHDVAVVAADRVDHQLERRVDYRARFLRVEVLLQLGRALDVGKQRGDDLALAFDLAGGFDEVGDPRRRTRRCGRSSGGAQCCAAISAESLAARVFGTAFWAAIAEFRAAVAAELLASLIFGATTCATHRITEPRCAELPCCCDAGQPWKSSAGAMCVAHAEQFLRADRAARYICERYRERARVLESC